jgi:outer membrane protein insertion porin family
LEAEQPVPEIYAGSRQFADEPSQPQRSTQIHYGASYSSDNELVGGVTVEHHVPSRTQDGSRPRGARPYEGFEEYENRSIPESDETWDDAAVRPGHATRTAFSPAPSGYRNDSPLLVRGQSPGGFPVYQPPQRTPGMHQGMPDPNQPTTAGGATYYPAGYGVNQNNQPPYAAGAGQPVTAFQPAGAGMAGTPAQPATYQPPFVPDSPLVVPGTDPFEDLPLDIQLQETQTGRLMVGVGVNSDAGLVGNLVIDEQNFDIFRPSFRWNDWVNGTAFRGAGQRFRIEAMPGTQVQRYSFSFQDPYFLDTAFSFGVSAFYFQRNYQDWDEQRGGGRLSLGYLFPERPDLSLALSVGAESAYIDNPVVPTPSQIAEVVGNNDLYTVRLQLAHDTRDSSFLPTEGHFISLATEYGFGSFQFPRFEADFRKYWVTRERPDGSGRHILGASAKVGVAGNDTPVFEHFFAGGFSTLRGFEFRGASPKQDGAIVGGEFQLLTSLEYRFPLTANDMLFGSFFVDAGTVEPNANLYADNFRITPGFELRISVPAMGPIPIAVGLGVPVAHATGDEIQNFHFFVGVTR